MTAELPTTRCCRDHRHQKVTQRAGDHRQIHLYLLDAPALHERLPLAHLQRMLGKLPSQRGGAARANSMNGHASQAV